MRDEASSHSVAGRRSAVPLYAGFLYAGALTVLLGVLLPRIASIHQLKDSQSGALLTIQFAASACGALFVRERLPQTLLRGYILMIAGVVAVIFLPASWAFAAIAVFSLGLGMAMTSTSMIVGRVFPASRGAAMSILNVCWSIGAALCPLIVARVPGHFSLAAVCVPLALMTAIVGALIIPRAFVLSPAGPQPQPGRGAPAIFTVLLFSAVAFLYVGTESAIGGWMSVYASRVAFRGFTQANLAAAAFWGALLLGRAITPAILRRVRERKLHLGAIAASCVGIVVLAAAHSAAVLLAGAIALGAALAPIFPLTISLYMERAGGTRDAGWVFAFGGFGGAVFPWAIGVVSSGTTSLRSGLLVTLGAAVGMFLLMLVVWVPSRRTLKTAVAESLLAHGRVRRGVGRSSRALAESAASSISADALSLDSPQTSSVEGTFPRLA